jgi:hypothetical protein
MQGDTHYNLPANLGENGQVLMTHGDGNLSWTPKNSPSLSTKYLSIDPTAFVGIGNNADRMYYANNDAEFIGIGGNNITGYVGAALSLPHGATITSVTFHYSDNDNTDMRFSMYRKTLNSASNVELATKTSLDSPTSTILDQTMFNADEAKVDNLKYTYKIIVRLDGHNGSINAAKHRLYSVVVAYEE